jgi:hypothetical protein
MHHHPALEFLFLWILEKLFNIPSPHPPKTARESKRNKNNICHLATKYTVDLI